MDDLPCCFLALSKPLQDTFIWHILALSGYSIDIRPLTRNTPIINDVLLGCTQGWANQTWKGTPQILLENPQTHDYEPMLVTILSHVLRVLYFAFPVGLPLPTKLKIPKKEFLCGAPSLWVEANQQENCHSYAPYKVTFPPLKTYEIAPRRVEPKKQVCNMLVPQGDICYLKGCSFKYNGVCRVKSRFLFYFSHG